MSYSTFPDTHNVIVDAISRDYSAVSPMTFAGVEVADFDSHDPLGMAFYVYGMLRTGYTNLVVASLPDAARSWVEERFSNGLLTPYIDRDLAAIGLITFAHCKYRRKCPENSERLAALAESYFKENSGVCESFFTSVLIALGLATAAPETNLYGRVANYVNSQIREHEDAVFNDPKNFVVAHLWAEQTQAEDLLKNLLDKCLKVAARDETPERDKVYLSYVLLEESERLPRSERPKVKAWIEESLNFIRTYSLESSSPANIAEQEYHHDSMVDAETRRQHGYSARPRLSRIIISVGLMLDRTYAQKASHLFSREELRKRIQRGVVYPLAMVVIAFAVLWFGKKIGLPLSMKPVMDADNFGAGLMGFLFRLPLNFLWAIIIVVLATSAWIFFYQVLLTGQTVSDIKITKNIRTAIQEHWQIEIIMAAIMALGAPFLFPS
jgi:hypothetical protein